MGNASIVKEHVLLTLPFKEPVDIINALRKQFHNYEFVYKQVLFGGGNITKYEPVPDGMLKYKCPFARWLIQRSAELYEKATIICTLVALPSSPEKAKNLKFIQFFSAGTDHVWDTPIYKDTDIPLTTSSGIHGPMISEWVVMQILAHSHKQKLLLKWQEEKRWGAHAELGQLKDGVGMRLAVLGYGSIGRQSAWRLQANPFCNGW